MKIARKVSPKRSHNKKRFAKIDFGENVLKTNNDSSSKIKFQFNVLFQITILKTNYNFQKKIFFRLRKASWRVRGVKREEENGHRKKHS